MKDFITKQEFILYSSDILKEERNKIDAFLSLLNRTEISTIIKKELEKENYQGRTPYDPYNMMATILYAFAMNIGELRELEYACKMRLDFMYMMEKETPSYVTFANYINNIILPNIDQIYQMITLQIMKEMGIDFTDLYLDGSKFEANANKYKFVYKPNKNLKNLCAKIQVILKKHSIQTAKETVTSHEVAIALSVIKDMIGADKTIRTGKGIRHSDIEKDYIELQKYLTKLLSYEEIAAICGEGRSSYYKTDHDATAMCLKEDYYSGLGSNMHAAYNVQFAVNKGLILGVYVSQDRNDYYTLIPTTEYIHRLYGTYPKNICADSGYGSYLNYKYLKDAKIENYVKYPSWKKEREGYSPQLFHHINEEVVCLNGKTGTVSNDKSRHTKSAGGKIYTFNGCLRCKYKAVCKRNLKKKTGNARTAEINAEYLDFMDQARTNLLSPKGIEMRINRSIQSEGDFGIVKQDLSYSRFRRRGLNKVKMEISLVALGLNIRKYFRFIQSGEIPNFWAAPEDLAPEKDAEIKLNPRKKKEKSVNQKAKDSYKKL